MGGNMKRKEAKTSARKAQAEPVVHIAGAVFEEKRKEFMRSKTVPRSFYAFSLSHGHARIDGRDEVGKLLAESGASIRKRFVMAWLKAGHVVVEHEGILKLGVMV